MLPRRIRVRTWDVLVLVLVVAVLGEVLTSNQDVPLSLSVPVALAMTLPLLWGERQPQLVAGIVLGAWVVQGLAGDWQLEPQSALLPVCLVFWSLGARLSERSGRWSCAVAFLALVAHEPSDVIVLGPLMIGVYASGRLMRSRDELARALEEERDRAERYAVEEERARIARELHDVVGHAVALMTVQAGAERLALGEARPETREALAQIETTGRQTLQEMRRMLGVLRTSGEPDLAPQPGLEELESLVARVSGAGLAVDLVVDGEPTALSPGVDISAYRIVQEALTNVLKHAGARRAQVRVEHAPEEVRLEVVDDGRGGAVNGHGHGIAGMRERVALYGGTLDAGPQTDGGWRLRATLPREPA